MKILVIGKEERVRRYTEDTAMLEQAELVCVPVGTDDAGLLAAGQDADFIFADSIGTVSGDVIRQMPNLKLIHMEGVGFNGIDLAAARARGIYVCNSKGVNAAAVAEQTVLLMLALLRDLPGGDRAVREGRQIQLKEHYMQTGSLRQLNECTVGLVGFGDIGRQTAKVLDAFGATVLYYAPSGEKPGTTATYRPLDALLAESDIVSLHLPASDRTRGMCNAEFFSKMKPGSYLINTARGEIVDTPALLAALQAGHLAGAGLDTIAGEPIQPDNPVLQTDEETARKLILCCHVAGITGAAFRSGYRRIWKAVRDVMDGKVPENVV